MIRGSFRPVTPRKGNGRPDRDAIYRLMETAYRIRGLDARITKGKVPVDFVLRMEEIL